MKYIAGRPRGDRLPQPHAQESVLTLSAAADRLNTITVYTVRAMQVYGLLFIGARPRGLAGMLMLHL